MATDFPLSAFPLGNPSELRVPAVIGVPLKLDPVWVWHKGTCLRIHPASLREGTLYIVAACSLVALEDDKAGASYTCGGEINPLI